ncbi:PxKF domain-containing protein [Azohydromonas aeria]|uniref:PxKF domain-containing protein n=1 Tax=Azohydromonas aeria TaxID=2590212 RepID=UPI0018DF175C|nr:PxKF domain-containing protein [Azohydromonas aeria]
MNGMPMCQARSDRKPSRRIPFHPRHSGTRAAVMAGFLSCGTALAAPFAYVPNTEDHTVSILDTATNEFLATIGTGFSPFGVAASQDSARAYVSVANSGHVAVVSAASKSVIATIPVALPSGLALTPNGRRLYVGSVSGGNVAVISTVTHQVVATIRAGASPSGVAASPDGSRIYVANWGSNNVLVISTDTNAVIADIPVGVSPYGVAVSPDGTHVYVANLGRGDLSTVSVISAASNTVVADIPARAPFGVAVTPDGKRVYVTEIAGSSVAVIDTATNAVIATVPVGLVPYGLSVTPDGKRVYVANRNSNSLSVIATATNEVVATLPTGREPNAFGQFIGPARFHFTGFFEPVLNPPALNARRAGAAVPLRFRLHTGLGLNVIAAGYPNSRHIACPGREEGATANNSSDTEHRHRSPLNLDPDSGTYTYVWKTEKAWAGTCRLLTLRLTDGSIHKALFQFR